MYLNCDRVGIYVILLVFMLPTVAININIRSSINMYLSKRNQTLRHSLSPNQENNNSIA